MEPAEPGGGLPNGRAIAMGPVADAAADGRGHGFPAALTSFVGRAGEVAEVAALLSEFRLVTVTGPGGMGKTRLAGEVARRVAGRFADGVWLVELASVQDPALVPSAVAVALGIRQPPGMTIADSLAGVLGRQQLLLVLDNCEHLIAAAAALCARLLPVADDIRILATSREPLGVAGEARFRLGPLGLPRPGDGAGAPVSEAAVLFTDRARRIDPHFTLTAESGPVVERLVARLDRMPLAIELAAARAESLGVAQLLERLNDRFALLVAGDRLAAPRQRSLAATVEWSYQLLSQDERRAFRHLAVFPGPFTLDAAEAVAGATAGSAVLHLVDCSLLVPPRTGQDGRARYLMLETLRGYGLERLAEVGEQPAAAEALAHYALQVAEEASAGLETSAGELAAAQWLDAEDATTQQALDWALAHDHVAALRLAVALSSWWRLRGRKAAGYALMCAATEHAAPGSDAWCTAQVRLGGAANEASFVSLGHYTAVRDALAAAAPSPTLIDCLAGRSGTLIKLGRIPEGTEDARRALAMAREIGYLAGEAKALVNLSFAASRTGDAKRALSWARQAHRIDPAGIPGWVARLCSYMLTGCLAQAGDVAAARRSGADVLARARQAGEVGLQADCLAVMADLELRAGRIPEAGACLRESLEITTSTGAALTLDYCLVYCGHLCAAAGRWAEAITLWAAHDKYLVDIGVPDDPEEVLRREEPTRKAEQALGAARMRAEEERGAAMSLEIAAEFAVMLIAANLHTPQVPPGTGQISARERELVTLVAQGRTDAQIAAQLYISVRTVRTHLDRIRDKTGCRRRADLTRLALQAHLV